MKISGWCNDKFHDGCKVYYMGKFEHTCACECHGEG